MWFSASFHWKYMDNKIVNKNQDYLIRKNQSTQLVLLLTLGVMKFLNFDDTSSLQNSGTEFVEWSFLAWLHVRHDPTGFGLGFVAGTNEDPQFKFIVFQKNSMKLTRLISKGGSTYLLFWFLICKTKYIT